jgi:anionic cell wall polymer biosynthesis LytR-Cps2A-Psr (LCP) family protein
VTAFILLLLFLAVVVGGLVAFRSFRKEVQASNGRVPAATKRALAPSGDVRSKPQLVMIVFDRASLFARTDPDRRLISLLSIPGSAYVRAPGGTTVGDVLGTAGAAGFVRFARSALNLQVTHVALLRPRDIAPLVDAVGGVQIEDASLSRGFGRPGGQVVLDGGEADHYVASAGPASSLTRRERERAVLEAVITRLASVASLSKLPHLARIFSATVATDLSPGETLALALVRLRSKLSIQCGLPEGWALERPRSKLVLRQFAGAKPTPRKQARIFPSNGCRATALSVRAPAAVIFFGKQALALFPFVPELAAVAVALDLILLLALLGAPQALIGIVRNGRTKGRRGPGAGGLAGDVHSPVHDDEAIERAAQAKASGGTERSYSGAPEPAPSGDKAWEMLRASQTLRAAVRRRPPLREHADAAWFLVGAAAAIVLGYVVAQL